MYHGAEHKCINCVEHGLPLTVENVLKFRVSPSAVEQAFCFSGHAGKKYCAAFCVCGWCRFTG